MNLPRTTRATSDSNTAKLQRTTLSRLWLPTVASALSVATVWSVTGGLSSCDSTAKFTVPDRKFYAIEAVTAFPAAFDANDGHFLGRVCGAPLLDTNGQALVGDDGQPVVEPAPAAANGVEVTANFMSSSLVKPPCGDSDKDNSIKAGELINLTRVITDSPATVTVGNFEFDVRCVGSQSDLSACTQTAVPIPAATVAYKNIVSRCDPGNVQGTLVNVALVLDNSGSMKGNVDKETLKEDALGYFDAPPTPLTNVASDWSGVRFNAATSFIDSLNANDRVVGYLYDENGPKIGSSDSYICNSDDPAVNGAWCHPGDGTCPAPGSCDQDPAMTNDNYSGALALAECNAFGSNPNLRADLENGLDLRRNAATGRASLWQTVENAYAFLSGGGANCPGGSFGQLNGMHIVVLTDGPDTCVDGDDFSYQSLKNSDTTGKCRTKCATSDVVWKQLMVRMAKARYPVHVHFVQFQAPGYKDPDPRMMEMACRTDGTYQFINSENFNKSASSGFSDALARAVNRVRNGLSGTWRVGYKWTSIPTESEFPKGAIRAIDGDFVFKDPKFDSLDPAVHDLDKESWRFTINGEEDRRVLMRMPCANDGDCAGSGDSCSANHCGEGGLCVSIPAPNGEPCGTNGTCRNGACTAGQSCTAAIKP